MNIAKAKLIKLKTNDGLVQMLPHVKLGKIYQVDLDSKIICRSLNLNYAMYHNKEVYGIVEDSQYVGVIPSEMLEIIGN